MISKDTNLSYRPSIGKAVIDWVIMFFKENLGILIGLFLMCLVLSIIRPSAFLTIDNFLNVLRQVSTNANLAFGMTLVIIIGGIDLSVGANLALSGTLAAGLIALNNIPVPIAILCGLAVGTFVGFINGFVISKTNIPPFIVTLATLNITRGAVQVYTGGQPIRVMEPIFNNFGNGRLGPIPLPIIYTLIFFVVILMVLNKTKLGRHIYAVGGNKNAAKFSGIKIKNVEIFIYTLIGFLAAFSGIVFCARMYSGQPTLGQGYELDAIAATVLGGTSMLGGVGRLGGTFIGVLIIGVLNNGLNILSINSFYQLIIKGIVILAAVYFDTMKKNARGNK